MCRSGSREAAGVDEDDGFSVQAELLEGEDLDGLLEGAEAAGEGDEAIGAGFHERLAFAQAGGDDELVGVFEGEFTVEEGLGESAGDAAAVAVDGAGEGAHEADAGAAVDEGVAAVADEAAKFIGRLEVRRIDGGA